MEHGAGPLDYRELRENWRMLVPCLAGIVLAGVNGFSLGVVIVPLEQEFGWSRAEITLGPFVIACMALVGGAFSGRLIDRFGPRRMGIVGVTLFCAALAFVSTASGDIASWWLRWALMGVAALFVIPTVWTTAINSLFERNRGMALAIALCGTGVSAAVVPSITQALVSAWGWRGAYVALGALSFAIVLPLVLLHFRSPADGRDREGASAGARALQGMDVREGFASPAFIKLTLAVLLFGVTSCALTANAVPVLVSKGVTAVEAAGLAGLVGIGSIAGRLGGGFLLDRFEARMIAALSVLAPIVSALLLLLIPETPGALAVACLLLGLSAGTEVDACAYLAARHFGMRSFGTLFGAVNGMVLFGAGLAPMLASRVYDVSGSYDTVLWVMIPVCIVAAILFLWLGPYPVFSRVERIHAEPRELPA